MEVLARELAQGSDANARNRDGWTPLLFAVEANQLHAVSLVRIIHHLLCHTAKSDRVRNAPRINSFILNVV